MKFCHLCLYPENHPLGLTFDDNGVCSGCRVHKEKDELDWNERRQRLNNILQEYCSRSGNVHDCIIPVSGGRDSYFIVETIKNRFGMNPLLVSYNNHYNTEIGIRNLNYLRTYFDADCLQMNIRPHIVKAITRESLRLKGSMYWHCLAGTTVYPVQVAVRMKIPLIIWGAHQGLDQVGMFSHFDEIEMSRKYRREHDLMGMDEIDLFEQSGTLNEEAILPYSYPHVKEIQSVGVRGIYLGNFIRWDTKQQHENMIAHYSFETWPQQRTFDSYNDVDSFHYSGIHDYIKFIKFGYGKIVDHVCREIRFNRLHRDQGLALVKKYLFNQPNDLDVFLHWLGMTKKDFEQLIEKFRNPKIWKKNDCGEWCLIDDFYYQGDANLAMNTNCQFTSFSKGPLLHKPDNYILIGRGYVDGYEKNPAIS